MAASSCLSPGFGAGSGAAPGEALSIPAQRAEPVRKKTQVCLREQGGDLEMPWQPKAVLGSASAVLEKTPAQRGARGLPACGAGQLPPGLLPAEPRAHLSPCLAQEAGEAAPWRGEPPYRVSGHVVGK